jgi:hypothetical protein
MNNNTFPFLPQIEMVQPPRFSAHTEVKKVIKKVIQTSYRLNGMAITINAMKEINKTFAEMIAILRAANK